MTQIRKEMTKQEFIEKYSHSIFEKDQVEMDLNEVIAEYEKGQPASLDSLIERVEKEKLKEDNCSSNMRIGYNSGLSKAIEIIRTTPIIEPQTASLESLIERIEGLKIHNGGFSVSMTGYDEAINHVLEILRTTPCIKTKALRKRGTNKWYFGSETSRGTLLSKFDNPIPYYDDVPNNLPEDAEEVPIEILIP